MKLRLFIALLLITTIARAGEKDSISNVTLNVVEVVSTVKENGAMRQQPVSVSLIGHKDLLENHMTSLKGASNVVPNVFIPDYGSRITSAIYIRGIGSRINTPAVGLYVDNVPYIDKSAFDFNFFDIERVDVMRGPQGTLYGRNTMGGLIHVYTKNPFYYNGTDAKIGFATKDNHFNASLVHYHRLNDKFAFSGGGYYEGSRGFFTNSLTGKRVDDVSSAGARIRALYKPTKKLTFDMSVNYDYSDEGAYPYYFTGVIASAGELDDIEGAEGKITNNREGSYRRNMLNVGLNIEYKSNTWQLNAVTGYQHLSDRMFMDQDFLAPDIYTLEQRQRINTINEEITIKSTKKGVWEWLSGANLMYQSLHTEAPVNFYADGVKWLQKNINSYMPDLTNMGMTMGVTLNDEQLAMGGAFDTPTLGAALFHQSTFNISRFWTIKAGLRLDYSHQSMDYDAPAAINYDFAMSSARMPITLSGLTASPYYNGTVKDDDVQLLPKLSIQYNIRGDKQRTVYASVSRGMRSGGYNVQMFSDLLQGAMRNVMMQQIKDGTNAYLDQLAQRGMPASVINMISGYLDQMPVTEEQDAKTTTRYKPEYSWNCELGTHLNYKHNGQQLFIDAAVFYNRIYEQQIARFAPSGLGRMMVNAGMSQSCGGELSMRWLPNRNIDITGSYGYTHAQFLEYEDGQGNDYTDNYVPYVPMHTMSIDAAYSWFPRRSCIKSITFGANCYGAGRIYWTESNSSSQAFYALLGARLAFRIQRATFVIWGKNLTNSTYNTFYFESASRGYEQHGKPLQFGFDLNLNL